MRRSRIDYGRLVESALRTVVRDVLSGLAKEGAPPPHHFYVTFRTHHPGVAIPEFLRDRFNKDAATTIWGHPDCTKRMKRRTGFKPIDPAKPLPAGVSAHVIGKPRRTETPFFVPSHQALVFGDAVAEEGGRLRVWAMERVDDRVERFYRERFNPTLKPLLELDFERVLVTHGQPVMKDGRKALRSALRSKPWYHRA